MPAHPAPKTQPTGAKQRRRYAPRLPPEQRREQLIDAALKVILEHGYEGISVEAVAREAGVTRPVVYDHYPNLAHLLRTVIEREEQRSLEQLQYVVPQGDVDSDPGDVLAQSLHRFLEAVSQRPATWRLTLLPPAGTPLIVREHVERNRAQILQRIEDLVRRSTAGADVDIGIDVELLARAIRDLAEEAGRMVLTDPERYTPDRYATFMESLMRLVRSATPQPTTADGVSAAGHPERKARRGPASRGPRR